MDLARAKGNPQLSQMEIDYSDAWTQALIFAAHADRESCAKIKKQWIDAWKDKKNTNLLVDALLFSKERVFLTDHIVDLFLKTDDVELARSIAKVMVYSGKPEDLAILQKKQRNTSDQKMSDMLEGAISWRQYYNHPELGPGGPQRLGF